jgi:predicted nucleotidyltransferase
MNNKDLIYILRCVVGSHAHGLATPESDFDYRGVFIEPTSEILKLDGHTEHTQWIEGKDDDTAWELGHFLSLAQHCNPTILETFIAPRVDMEKFGINPADFAYGEELRDLFPYVWNSKGVMDAFIGYGLNQRKKFLDNKDGRSNKFAAAYLLTCYNAWELLSTGTFTIKIVDTEIGETVRRFKNGDYTIGEVVDTCLKWQHRVEDAYRTYPEHAADLTKVNDFLLKVRKENW